MLTALTILIVVLALACGSMSYVPSIYNEYSPEMEKQHHITFALIGAFCIVLMLFTANMSMPHAGAAALCSIAAFIFGRKRAEMNDSID